MTLWKLVTYVIVPLAVLNLVRQVAPHLQPIAIVPGVFLWALCLYPITRRQRPIPLGYYIADGDRIVPRKFLTMAVALALAAGVIYGFTYAIRPL